MSVAMRYITAVVLDGTTLFNVNVGREEAVSGRVCSQLRAQVGQWVVESKKPLQGLRLSHSEQNQS
eukprot:349397-Amphidinium_carterae.1